MTTTDLTPPRTAPRTVPVAGPAAEPLSVRWHWPAPRTQPATCQALVDGDVVDVTATDVFVTRWDDGGLDLALLATVIDPYVTAAVVPLEPHPAWLTELITRSTTHVTTRAEGTRS